jgi:glycosyltransferase involved in cell wall biosynthesis
MALLKDTAPDLRLEIAGEGPCRDELDALSTELSLDDRVTLLGRISDVAGLLTRARMFALSSLTEGVSLTLLEAMGRGLPVVATSVGGNTEVVADGVTGLLVPPSRPDLLAAALSSLAADPHRATEMGRAGRRRVEERFDLGRTIAEYERLYETILAGNTFSRVG